MEILVEMGFPQDDAPYAFEQMGNIDVAIERLLMITVEDDDDDPPTSVTSNQHVNFINCKKAFYKPSTLAFL